ncbi:hypothetical protein H0A61_00002 [Koleobacter methoxysyntrophicus]|uniref:Uncharacterized protein n=1 Tax=Koleobacter methoxysyntrophicus TaxID=2751313 RepID=A0A8A0RKB6_9FIRM|nr:hypothetical protein [Koleobacter methoxysyntrophicus]QSQ07686.1 hypothetical protein H0A61_00002 [Koleobacter methoxysyntrophicus]
MFETILSYIIIAGLAVFLFKTRRKPPDKISELFSFRKIAPDGLIDLDGRRFRLVLEVDPINLALKSAGEQNAVWNAFRSAVASLKCNLTLLVQTQYLDLSEYIRQQKAFAESAPTEELQDTAERLVGFFRQKFEESAHRTRKYYIILRHDYTLERNPLISARRKKEEKENIELIARQELEDSRNILTAALSPVGLRITQLTRHEVLQMIYRTLCRQLANIQPIEKADYAEAFCVVSRSATPLIKELLGGEEDFSEEETEGESKKNSNKEALSTRNG